MPLALPSVDPYQELEGLKQLITARKQRLDELVDAANEYWATLLELRQLREQYRRLDAAISRVQVKVVKPQLSETKPKNNISEAKKLLNDLSPEDKQIIIALLESKEACSSPGSSASEE